MSPEDAGGPAWRQRAIMANCCSEVSALVLILLAVGTIASLVTGVWQLGRAEALAAFFLYQAALGVADLITIGLRSGRHRQAATLRTRAAGQDFNRSMAHYRQVRARMLECARQGDFDTIRQLVPEQVRPAYDRVKNALSALGDSTGRNVPATATATPQKNAPAPAAPQQPGDPSSAPGRGAFQAIAY